ncbi:hypothetical protein SprV_0501832600 [Sparganum proliferum]
MQRSMDLFVYGHSKFGPTTSTEKTVALHQPVPKVDYAESHISDGTTHLTVVEKLAYRRITSSRNIKIGYEIPFADTLKTSLKHLEISPEIWEDPAQYRRAWRTAGKIGVGIFEANRIAAAREETCKTQELKTSDGSTQSLPS